MTPSNDKIRDLIIIGAGPTGLAAAMYASREGMDTLILDKSVVGGMAAITDLIDNYPGFESGVSGLELTDHLEAHARRFGAQIETGRDVTGLTKASGHWQVETATTPVRARAMLLATGSTYKQLDIPGEQEYIGRGVHFCATCDAPLYRGGDIIVIGGGNSAIQESLFIARFAKSVTLLVRGASLKGTKVLQDELASLSNVHFQFNTIADDIRNNGQKVTGLHARNTKTNEELDFRTDAVFVFIGLIANTHEFISTLKTDRQGFIETNSRYETSQKGIYAAGDVRSGATWQIAAAIGEGVAATLEIREHLSKLHRSSEKPPAPIVPPAVSPKRIPTSRAKR